MVEVRNLQSAVFLMTDIEGRAKLWEERPDEMGASLLVHDNIVSRCAAEFEGDHIRPRGEGDSHFIVFTDPSKSVHCAIAIQTALVRADWPGPALTVRIGIHMGESLHVGSDYYGTHVNRTARIRALASGGQILVSNAVAESARKNLPGATFEDLGPHRLKDLMHPENLWQVSSPGLPREFQNIASISNLPNNLPIQRTSFIGREFAILQILELARTKRFVTLLGPGGCGKSRIAMQVAAEMVDSMPAGVWWIELASLEDPNEIVNHINEKLGIHPNHEAPLQALNSWLRGKKCLLAIDNCEHLAEPLAEILDDLIATHPSLFIVATSRHALQIEGEHIVRIAGLGLPSSADSESAERCLRSEAAQLLLDRVCARDASYKLGDADAASFAGICKRLDGLPLPLELAAAKVALMGPKKTLERLDDMFGLLQSSQKGSLAKNQTIEAAIGWSFKLLSVEERLVLTRLSPLAPVWSLETAEAVAAHGGLSKSKVTQLVEDLFDKALIQRTVDSRYYLLEPIRQYAARDLSESEHADVMGRLCNYYSKSAAAIEQTRDADKVSDWHVLAAAEVANIRKAIARAFEAKDAAALGYLCLGIRQLWQDQRLFTEANSVLDDAFEINKAVGGMDPMVQARLHNLSGVISWWQNDLSRAKSEIETGLEMFKALDAPERVAGALNNLGLIAVNQEDLHAAREYYASGAQVAKASRNLGAAATATANLASLDRDAKNYEMAIAGYRKALELYGDSTARATVETIRASLAFCYACLSRWPECLTIVKEDFATLAPPYQEERTGRLLLVCAMYCDAVGEVRRSADLCQLIVRIDGTPTEMEEGVHDANIVAILRELLAKQRVPSANATPHKDQETVVEETKSWLKTRS